VDQPRTFFSGNHLEALTRLDGSQDANESLRDAFAAGDVLGEVFLALRAVEVEVWPVRSFGESLRMLGESLGLPLDEAAEVLDLQALLGEKAFHRISPTQREIAFEQDAIEARDHSGDPFAILTKKAFHGVPLSLAV